MANIDDFNAKLEAIQAIPDDKVLTPSIPIDVFIQEAENLYQWSCKDIAVLTNVGITQELIDELPVRAGACRLAESRWFKERYTQEQAAKDWKIQSPAAYELRDELLHVFRYAFRDYERLLARVATIADGDGHADMIQDLSDLSELGRSYQDMLTTVAFDVTKLDTADTLSNDMAALLAAANGTKNEKNEAKVLRDKAYTYLKMVVDEIRAAGKYVFWKDENRLKGYKSYYWIKKNRSSAKTE